MMNIAYFEACDFISYPMGGTLTFSKQLINAFSETFSLIGFVNANEPVGEWFLREIDGRHYNYFGICTKEDVERAIIPKRAYSYYVLKKYSTRIKEKSFDYAFTQTPQFAVIVGKYNLKSFCFLFAGLGNSVSLSRYKYLRFLGSIYEDRLIRCLKKHANKVLAASDNYNIKKLCEKYNLPSDFITKFPTRFDNKIFKLIDASECRVRLKINEKTKVFVTTGRLSYIKGWMLLIDAFRLVKKVFPDSILIFVGDGEDKAAIVKYCENEILSGDVRLEGRKAQQEVATYLNAADVFVLGSIVEGWPTSIVEALACGKSIVTTNVSGAIDMVEENINGYVSVYRDPEVLSLLMLSALELPNPNLLSLQKSVEYSIENLKDDFNKVWLNELH